MAIFINPAPAHADLKVQYLLRVDSITQPRYEIFNLEYPHRFLKRSPIALKEYIIRESPGQRRYENLLTGVKFLKYCSETPDGETKGEPQVQDDYTIARILDNNLVQQYLLPLNMKDQGYAGYDDTRKYCEDPTPYVHWEIAVNPGWKINITLLKEYVYDDAKDLSRNISHQSRLLYPMWHLEMGLPTEETGQNDHITRIRHPQAVFSFEKPSKTSIYFLNRDGKVIDATSSDSDIAEISHIKAKFSAIVNGHPAGSSSSARSHNMYTPIPQRMGFEHTLSLPFGDLKTTDSEFVVDYFEQLQSAFVKMPANSRLEPVHFTKSARVTAGSADTKYCKANANEITLSVAPDAKGIEFLADPTKANVRAIHAINATGICKGFGTETAYDVELMVKHGRMTTIPKETPENLFKEEVESDLENYLRRYNNYIENNRSYVILPPAVPRKTN